MLKRLNYQQALLAFCAFSSVNTVFAVSAPTSPLPFGLKPILSLATGVSFFASSEQSQSMMPLDLCHYTYQPEQFDYSHVLFGGFIGAELARLHPWTVIAGVGYYQPGSITTDGLLTQGADLVSDTPYRYDYKTRSQQILLEGRMVWTPQKQMQPFFMVGIGTSINKMYDYRNNVPPTYEFTPYFANHTKTSFTYSIGPGVDFSVTNSFHIGVSYRFTDFGSAHTSSGFIDETPIANQLKQAHLYANQLLVQFTFIPWNN